MIAVVCPRCLRNLEAGQEPVNRRFRTRFAIPVRYFTDLVAEAFWGQVLIFYSGADRTIASEG